MKKPDFTREELQKLRDRALYLARTCPNSITSICYWRLVLTVDNLDARLARLFSDAPYAMKYEIQIPQDIDEKIIKQIKKKPKPKKKKK